MPQAVTHILVPILLAAIYRDFFHNKKGKKFSLHYVLLAGLGGVLPDIDIIFSLFLRIFTDSAWWIHKTFTHSILFPISLFALFVILSRFHPKSKIYNLGRHRLKLSLIFLALCFGVIMHLLLDSIFGTQSFLFYPFSPENFGLGLAGKIPIDYNLFMATLDGVLLVIWITYLEVKHRISDFI